MKYRVDIIKIENGYYEVEADSENEAENRAMEMVDNGKISYTTNDVAILKN